MKFHSWMIDKKINGINFGLEMTMQEYAELAEGIIERNELQRKRVRESGKIYQLLKKDLLDGCVMPPIVLAITEKYGAKASGAITKATENNALDEALQKEFQELIGAAVEDKELLILDGLQRTFTIRQCIMEARSKGQLQEFEKKGLRAEVYVGLSKTGILYRMLTLNTGQTPMSFRHQLEILYHDYLEREPVEDGIRVVREVEEAKPQDLGSYKFSDVIDMFYAFSTETAVSYDRQALVAQLKELEFLEDFLQGQDDFWVLAVLYHRFVCHLNDLGQEWKYEMPEDEARQVERPFGRAVPSVFARVQPMTGFGAECKRLMKRKGLTRVSELNSLVDGSRFKGTGPDESLSNLIFVLDQIAGKAKKIGDAQRAYFQLCFRELFTEESDSFQDLSACWVTGQGKYEALYG
ncbi:MAG: hypothetical protein AB1646_07945 [Thermodesulfobacteriota bacterium]